MGLQLPQDQYWQPQFMPHIPTEIQLQESSTMPHPCLKKWYIYPWPQGHWNFLFWPWGWQWLPPSHYHFKQPFAPGPPPCLYLSLSSAITWENPRRCTWNAKKWMLFGLGGTTLQTHAFQQSYQYTYLLLYFTHILLHCSSGYCCFEQPLLLLWGCSKFWTATNITQPKQIPGQRKF